MSVELRSQFPEVEAAPELTFEKVKKQWGFLTEAVKQEIVVDQALRESLANVVQSSVSENLPFETFEFLSSKNERIKKLWNRYFPEIGSWLSGAVRLVDFNLSNNQAYLFYFARDLKCLAFAAECLDHPLAFEGDSETELPSGTRVFVDREAVSSPELAVDLLNPLAWENRQKIHDRVYRVKIGEKFVILKERKTVEHLSQFHGGYVPTLTSSEEFRVAKKMNADGHQIFSGLEIGWEKPLAYVEFPDGFSFTIFEDDPTISIGLDDDTVSGLEKIRLQVLERLRQNSEQLRAEFQVVKELVEKEFVYNKNVQRIGTKIWERAAMAVNCVLKRNILPPGITFEDYLTVKSYWLINQAENLMDSATSAVGYRNGDKRGKAFFFSKSGYFGVVGFDYEYFKAEANDQEFSPEEIRGRFEKNLAEDLRVKPGFNFVPSRFNRVQAAIYLAISQANYLELTSKNS